MDAESPSNSAVTLFKQGFNQWRSANAHCHLAFDAGPTRHQWQSSISKTLQFDRPPQTKEQEEHTRLVECATGTSIPFLDLEFIDAAPQVCLDISRGSDCVPIVKDDSAQVQFRDSENQK